MTVQKLRDLLSVFDGDTEITSMWDWVTDMPVHGIIAHKGRVVLNCEKGDAGDITAEDIKDCP